MPKKILIIDDSATARIAISKILAQEGFLVTNAASGKEGIQKAKENKPDLVVVDTIMPEFDGYEVCRMLRSLNELTGLKIILVTGMVEAIKTEKIRECGVDGYLIKTADCTELIKAIHGLLK